MLISPRASTGTQFITLEEDVSVGARQGTTWPTSEAPQHLTRNGLMKWAMNPTLSNACCRSVAATVVGIVGPMEVGLHPAL